ncbi:DNA repair protein RAD5B [Paramyrothecium foliicola]|nr:DNA repair protein RAD5B [Paramyrothecium foliicola]
MDLLSIINVDEAVIMDEDNRGRDDDTLAESFNDRQGMAEVFAPHDSDMGFGAWFDKLQGLQTNYPPAEDLNTYSLAQGSDANLFNGAQNELDRWALAVTEQDAEVWLQKPYHHQKSSRYENPHMIRFPELDVPQLEPATDEVLTTAPAPGDEVHSLEQAVLAASHRLERQTAVTGDLRLKTKLLPHQEKGLSFMLERESGDIPDEFRLWKPAVVYGNEVYVHKITKMRSAIRPNERGGGILADEMGMGKTLSMLALILKTIEDGHTWAENENAEDLMHEKIQQHAHSTLIVCPSAWLINEWMNEIQLHLGNAVTCIKYHGTGRQRNVTKLCEVDIVLTTYKTLATDTASTRKDTLHRINWFRVVLDEAHMIRRTATTFHRACAGLSARSRWCLTGTPIQNGLEDIGALFVFLRAEPFHSLAQFRRFIVAPFLEREPIVMERLVMLYDSLVIQRSKDLLDLPGQEEQTKELQFSPDEKLLYERTAKILARRLREQIGEKVSDSRFGLFQVHLQLRLLCNHGTYQNLLSWTRTHQSVDDKEAFLAEVGFSAERVCVICRQPKPVLASRNVQQDFIEGCAHIVCFECSGDLEESPGEGGNLQEDLPRHCPICRELGKSIQKAAAQATDDGSGDIEMQDTPAPDAQNYFNATGFSTKMSELVKDLRMAENEMVRDENGGLQKCKSIIFSCWTKTLDLIEHHLDAENIDHLRIDGQSNLSRRLRILKDFTDRPGPQILLMTTGTGAYGLNLTAANRIFIIELQWNPSVERQAIARAIRINQRDKVRVIRYMISDTVEQVRDSGLRNYSKQEAICCDVEGLAADVTQEMKSQQVKKWRAARAGVKRPTGSTSVDGE